MSRALIFAALAGAWLTLGASSCYNAVVGTDAQAAKTVTVQTLLAACDDYQQALKNAAARNWLGVLKPEAVAKIDGVRERVNPLCPGTGGGQVPGGPTDVTVTIVKDGTAQIIDAYTVH